MARITLCAATTSLLVTLAAARPVVSVATTERLSPRTGELLAGPVLTGGGVAWAELARDRTMTLRWSRPGTAGRPRPRILAAAKNPNWQQRHTWITDVAGSRSTLAFIVEVEEYDSTPRLHRRLPARRAVPARTSLLLSA